MNAIATDSHGSAFLDMCHPSLNKESPPERGWLGGVVEHRGRNDLTVAQVVSDTLNSVKNNTTQVISDTLDSVKDSTKQHLHR